MRTTHPSTRARITPVPLRLPPGVLAILPVEPGSAPGTITTAYGSVWVAALRAHYLWRIDPRTDKIQASIDIGIGTCARSPPPPA